MAVVEYGGVSKAAERLHLSQPSISAGLKALEEELGGTLFDRGGPANRPLRLTPAGQRFYRRAQEILSQCEAARLAFSGGSIGGKGLRLGLLDTLPRDVVADALARFAAQEPDTRLESWEGTAGGMERWFAQDRLDAVWGNIGDLTPHSRVLWREPLLAVVAAGHAYARPAGTIALGDLARVPFVHRSNCELDALGRARLKAARVKLDVLARVEREELAFQLVRHGKAITLAPRSLVPADLVTLPVSGLDIERSIGLRWRETTPPEAISALSAAIEAAAAAR